MFSVANGRTKTCVTTTIGASIFANKFLITPRTISKFFLWHGRARLIIEFLFSKFSCFYGLCMIDKITKMLGGLLDTNVRHPTILTFMPANSGVFCYLFVHVIFRLDSFCQMA